MRPFLILPLFIVLVINGFSQKIETDIFGDFKYESSDGHYKAYLQKNVFDDLVFTDNMDNKVNLLKKYIELEYGELSESKDMRLEVLNNLIKICRYEKNYRATYSVDVFDKVVIEENKSKNGESFENGEHGTIEKDISGAFKYESNFKKATLKKEIFGNWEYEDSDGNEIRISDKTWCKLKNKFGSEENILLHLIRDLLHD